MSHSRDDEFRRLERERDFYRAILELGAHNEFAPFLKRALALLVAETGATRGYLEVRGDDADAGVASWFEDHALTPSDLAGIRDKISSGIVAKAISTGSTIFTSSALLDESFRLRESVQIHKIEAVLCAPIGGDAARGVVYLQGPAGVFTSDAQRWAELLARHLAPLAERLIVRKRADDATDATRELRRSHRLDGFIGRSAAIARALRDAMSAAPLPVNVLLLGASGTGKSQLARTIHENSARSAGPFVDLNCAALPETLIESELFGARAGSHSEARRDVAGKVAAAEGGTLFLDEIGELPLSAQAKLLQLLHEKRYYPLGSPAPVRADVRIIAATNLDLEAAVRERRFREDLFYRLHVLTIRLPSLAERREDVALLADQLTALVCQRNGLPELALGVGALAAIRASEWPGNVRQLEHALEAAAIRAAGERLEQIAARHVFPSASTEASEDLPRTFQEATRMFQRELLEKTLDETGWNVAETARRLELARSHVYNLIGAFALGRKESGRGAHSD